MLGAAIYDEITIYFFIHNHKIGKWDNYHMKI